MKIKIITIHAMHNPGSVLQAYALQHYLQDKGDVEIIDYRPDYFYNEGSKIKLFLKKLLYRKKYQSRDKKFNDFINKKMNLTPEYRTFENLKEANMSADVFIAGSDQLWNSDFNCGRDPAFYLKFVKKGKKISYSTSVGKKNIDEKNKEILINNLKEFDKISVRERNTSIALTEILNKKVEWVCDPVFLLPAKVYLDMINYEPLINEKYVMIYLAPKSELLDSMVAYYKQRGYKVILAGGVTKRCNCDKHIIDVGPLDFLNLIYHADIVISTSFHATAFCHIFHKNFITIPPKTNGERIISLLEQTRLLDRAVNVDEEFTGIYKDIDWQKVDLFLEEYINTSKEFLNTAIQNDK